MEPLSCHSGLLHVIPLHASLWLSSIDHFHQSLQKTKAETKMAFRWRVFTPISFLLFNPLSNHRNLHESRLLSNDNSNDNYSYYEQPLKEWINSGVLKNNLHWMIHNQTIFHGPGGRIEILKQSTFPHFFTIKSKKTTWDFLHYLGNIRSIKGTFF